MSKENDHSRISRRVFLKNSAAAAAGLTMLPAYVVGGLTNMKPADKLKSTKYSDKESRIYFEKGSEKEALTVEDIREGLYSAFDQLGAKKKVLAIPPDYTRLHSEGGLITQLTHEYFQDRLTDVLPALGTHAPMTEEQINKMYGDVPKDLFHVHDWRNDVVNVGEVPGEYVKKISEGKVDYSWPAQVNKMLVEGDHDLILSIGQVVPHEVTGMANFNKNIFVGTGGSEGINKSHFLGAVYGMERMMGRAKTPVRDVLNYASRNFTNHLPIIYILTVMDRDSNGEMVMRGLYIGNDMKCFEKAAELSINVNFTMLEKPLEKVVVYLDPEEYESTWLGNKSIYRTRMAIADGGELIVLAPGVKKFGEDPTHDRLIRKYGYVGTPRVLELTKNNRDLQQNLSVAAHLIHGSSENRFSITFCPGKLSKEEIESVNFQYADLDAMMEKYPPQRMKEGYNEMPDGEQVYYISNPGAGLWAWKEKV
ncbi:MAG: lactate racemase domain-containing protein [Bacteroidales bacterium]